MTSITEITKKLTPAQRSANARKAALAGAEKRKEASKAKPAPATISISPNQPKRGLNRLSSEEVQKFLDGLSIETGNPIPEKIRKIHAYDIFLDKLEPGQNVFFEDERFVTRLAHAAIAYGKKNSKSFVSRSAYNKEGKKVFGLWRVL